MLAHLLAFARAHDPGLAALKRATRAAVVMPAAFALGSVVIGQPQVAWPARPSNWPPRPITAHSPQSYS